MTTAEFLAAVARLNRTCGHDHQPDFYRGFAQYTGPWCPPWAKLVAEQRNTRRGERGRGQ